MPEQSHHLIAGHHRRQPVLIPGADLGEHRPVLTPQLLDKEQPCAGGRLPDRLGLPPLDGFDVQEVVAHLTLGQKGWIALEVISQETELTIVGMPGARLLITQRQQLRIVVERCIRMLILKRVRTSPPHIRTMVEGQRSSCRGWRVGTALGLDFGN